MEIVGQEFKIKALDNDFRIANINAIQINSIATVMDLDDYEKTDKLYHLALEFIEVKIEGQWLHVKEKKKEVYWPANIVDNVQAIKQLAEYFIANVIFKSFQKSSE